MVKGLVQGEWIGVEAADRLREASKACVANPPLATHSGRPNLLWRQSRTPGALGRDAGKCRTRKAERWEMSGGTGTVPRSPWPRPANGPSGHISDLAIDKSLLVA